MARYFFRFFTEKNTAERHNKVFFNTDAKWSKGRHNMGIMVMHFSFTLLVFKKYIMNIIFESYIAIGAHVFEKIVLNVLMFYTNLSYGNFSVNSTKTIAVFSTMKAFQNHFS